MSDLDDEFDFMLNEIKKSIKNYSDDEQNIIRSWTTKLSEPLESENSKRIRNEYADALLNTVSKNDRLEYPFANFPQDEFLKPLKELITAGSVFFGNKTTSLNKEPSPPKNLPKAGSPGKSPSKGFSPGRSPSKKGSVLSEKVEPKEKGSREPSPTLGKKKESRELSPPLNGKGKESREPSPFYGEEKEKSRESSPLHKGKGRESRELSPSYKEKGKKSKESSASHGEAKDIKEKRYSYIRLPCVKRLGEGSGAVPKSKKPSPSIPEFFDTNKKNEFEDFDEMAKIIARSKGQSFAEFVAAISRHTADFGQELRAAMKNETSNFREYVDHVLSQRIKDLTEVLNEEQNTELEKIKRDIDKWQLELSHCKKRIKEIIPDFDLNVFKKDKNYLKKVFAIDFSSGLPRDESAKIWKDETRARLDWYGDMFNKMRRCNDRFVQELNVIKNKTLDLEAQKSLSFQKYMQFLNSASYECQKMKEERDRLSKENDVLLSEIQDLGNLN